MSDTRGKGAVVCPNCGSTDFKQIVNESYYRFLDNKGEIAGAEEDIDRDIGFGPILCCVCEADCTEGFDLLEIENELNNFLN